ncbi:ABC transporter transmembrane domain-containing protein [Bacillus sp. SN10]|uniref:ABC transporter transmembrane domain-containing protein n=1 Tax=Bacillus sp. SN10 TaxID=2056493 RepID=UPI0022B7EAA6|nr:ABC transporter transmembrane domain-containing protein [Bacillus sp. SN10]
MKEFVTEQLVSFVSGLFAILGAVVVLLWIDWKMTLLLLTAVPLTIFVTYPLGEKTYAISKANQDELAGFSGRLGRILTNIRLVKASQTEQQELAGGKKQIQQLYKYGVKRSKNCCDSFTTYDVAHDGCSHCDFWVRRFTGGFRCH